MMANVKADFGPPISEALGESHPEALGKAGPIERLFGEERFDIEPRACSEREVRVLTAGVEVRIEAS